MKIPKRQSESVYQRRTETTLAKRKSTKDKQRSTKHTYTTKNRVTRTPLNTGGELMCSGRVSSSCSTSGTRRVNLVTNPVINIQWGRTGKCLRQGESICGHLWERYSIVVNQSWWRPSNLRSDDFNLLKGTLRSVDSLLAATLYQGNYDRNHKLWNIVSSERYMLHMQVLFECCYI